MYKRQYHHVAFTVCDEDMDTYVERIRSLGLDVMVPRKVDGAGERSIYFDDADHHLFELHSLGPSVQRRSPPLFEGAA